MNQNNDLAIKNLQDQIEKLHMKIDALAKACKVSLDYQPHDYQVNQIPDEDEELDG